MIALVALSVAISVSDARDRLIPNRLSVLLACTGLVFQGTRALFPHVAPSWGSVLPAPGACLAWASCLLVAGVTVELAHRAWTGHAGLGLGDVKCLAAWACTLGPLALVSGATGCLCGALVAASRRKATFALGPWLCAGSLLALVACRVAAGA